MEYGIQMYSVRDITEKNMDGALKALAEMGYKFVEFAGFFGIPADEIKAMLDKYGLKVSGTHTGWQEIAEHYEETLAYHKAIGNTRIIVPGADLTTKAKLDAFIDMMNEFQPKLAAEGITLGYHNHDIEFMRMEDGSLILELLYDNAPALQGEIDTFWVQAGGQNPADWVRKLSGRMPLLHLKDYGIHERQRAMFPIGSGNLDWKSIIAEGEAAGVEYFIVEQDVCLKDPFDSLADSLHYLVENFVK